MQHLTTLKNITAKQILQLIAKADDFAQYFKNPAKNLTDRQGHTLVNMFFEPSTRTRVSFELAAYQLGMNVINLDAADSSVVKGESILDTLHTLESMGCAYFSIRHQTSGIADFLSQHATPQSHIINAGDGMNEHPTQGLLDAYTIVQNFGSDLSNRSILVVGDILHSRVAQSSLQALITLGIGEIRICGPVHLLPHSNKNKLANIQYFQTLDDAIKDVDVVMLLRIQKERMQTHEVPDTTHYFEQYGLTEKRLQQAHQNAIVMHPGPVNRGIEIAPEIMNAQQSVILQQVRNGVFMRMAILHTLCRVP